MYPILEYSSTYLILEYYAYFLLVSKLVQWSKRGKGSVGGGEVGKKAMVLASTV